MPAEKTFGQQLSGSSEVSELSGRMDPFGDTSFGILTPTTLVTAVNANLPSFEPAIRYPGVRLVNLRVDNEDELNNLSLANRAGFIDPDILEEAKKNHTPVFIRVSVPGDQSDKLYVYGDKLGTGQWAFNAVSNPSGEVRAHAYTLFLSGNTTIQGNDPYLTPDLIDAIEKGHMDFKDRPAGKFMSQFVRTIPKDLFTRLRNNFYETVSSFTDILIPKTNTAEWMGGLFILPALNNFQILFTTSAEFLLRTASSAITKNVTKLYDKIKLPDKNEYDQRLFGNILVNGLLMAALSIPWCIGQTVSLAADVLSYTRQLLDSASHILNPGWWACKGYEAITGTRTNTPSAGIVAKTLLSSTLKLLPTAGAIALVALTAGFATPLAAVGSTLGSVFLGGATAFVSKIFAACEKIIAKKIASQNIGSKIMSFFENKSETQREIEMQEAPRVNPRKNSTAEICDRKHLGIKNSDLKSSTDVKESPKLTIKETPRQSSNLSTPLLKKSEERSDTESEGRRPGMHH